MSQPADAKYILVAIFLNDLRKNYGTHLIFMRKVLFDQESRRYNMAFGLIYISVE